MQRLVVVSIPEFVAEASVEQHQRNSPLAVVIAPKQAGAEQADSEHLHVRCINKRKTQNIC